MGNIFSFFNETFFESEEDKKFRKNVDALESKYDGASLDTLSNNKLEGLYNFSDKPLFSHLNSQEKREMVDYMKNNKVDEIGYTKKVKEIHQKMFKRKILDFFNVTLPTSVTLTNPELYSDLYYICTILFVPTRNSTKQARYNSIKEKIKTLDDESKIYMLTMIDKKPSSNIKDSHINQIISTVINHHKLIKVLEIKTEDFNDAMIKKNYYLSSESLLQTLEQNPVIVKDHRNYIIEQLETQYLHNIQKLLFQKYFYGSELKQGVTQSYFNKNNYIDVIEPANTKTSKGYVPNECYQLCLKDEKCNGFSYKYNFDQVNISEGESICKINYKDDTNLQYKECSSKSNTAMQGSFFYVSKTPFEESFKTLSQTNDC